MGIKMVDTAEPMNENGYPVARAKHIWFDDSESLQKKLDNGSLSGGGSGYTQLSQAEYDALSDDEKMNGKEYRTYDTGHIYRLGVEYGKDADIKRNEVLKTYVSLYDLNTKKGLSLAWENNVDNTQKIIDALEGREEFIDGFSSSTNRIGIVGNYGTTINNFHIIKRSADLAIITATTNAGTILNRTYTNGTLSDWCVNIAVYTSLAQLGLTAPVSIGEAFNAMPDKSQLMLNVNNSANADATVTDAPHNQGVLIINKHNNSRFGIEFNYSLGGNGNTIRKWVGTLKGSDGTGLNWKEVAYLNDHAMKSYSSLADLELDETATINDIVGKMANTSMFVYKTDVFDLSQYENLQLATVAIIKQSANRVQAIMTDKDTGNLYIGRTDGTNKFVGWQEMATKDNLIVQTVSNSSSATDKVPSANIMARELFGNNISDTSMNILELGAGQWKVDSNAKASSLKNMPVAKAGRLTIVHLQGNDGLTPYTSTYKYAMYKYISINGDEYVRTLNSDGTIGNIVNDTGWQQIVTKSYVDSVTGNTFNGKSVKTLMIDLSNASLQYTGTSDYGEVSLANYINNNINIIRVEGYYNPPSDSSYNNKYVVVAGKGSGTGIGYMSYLNGKWSFVSAKSKGGSLKGNGFIKVYYID